MKNTPQAKKICHESPKTPGGISKSLLTPCRRVGLSRNWRSKGTISPFISPLGSSNSIDEKQNESRKRKKGDIEERDKYSDNNINVSQLQEDDQNENLSLSCNTPMSTLNSTPSRLILKKKSKTLILTGDEIQNDSEQVETTCKYDSEHNNSDFSSLKEKQEENSVQTGPKVSKLLRLNTKNKNMSNNYTANEISQVEKEKLDDKTFKINNNSNNSKEILVSKKNTNEKNEEKSPNNLTQECIIVIQKNISKSNSCNANAEEASSEKKILQTACISDNDDIPLCNISSKPNLKQDIDIKSNGKLTESKNYVKKIDKTTSVTDLKTKTKLNKYDKKPKVLSRKTPSHSSNSFDDDDDDDDFQINKRTILVKKSYSKLVKPTKAKSTGSISQKDLDDICARIEQKKNLLLAKAMSNETEELRGLIKRWQHGCQTALIELLDLMKKKMPGQNMDYSEILKMLNIPSDLVGYDSENDCFNTPDDKNILLSSFDLNKI